MRKLSKSQLFYLVSLLFLVANVVCIVNEFFYFPLISFGLVVAWFALFRLDSFFIFLSFVTPISVWYQFGDLGFSFSFPTEPLFFGTMCLFWLKVLIEGNLDKRLLKHPVSIALFALLGWQSLSILTSSMPMVSLKYFTSNFWYVTVFYFLGYHVFLNKKRIHQFWWAYLIPFTGVVIYSIINHAGAGFTHKATGWVNYPFVENHGIYGAMLTFCIPFLALFTIKNKAFTNRPMLWVMSGFLTLLFCVALIFSYTRAAWLGLGVSIAIPAAFVLRIKFSQVLIAVMLVGAGALYYQFELSVKLGRNKTHSANDLGDHFQSMSNVKNDVSNLERINRWKCAERMFYERPITGWGPGTYMFQYAPFQKKQDMTIISTNNHDVGGIHSEYFNPTVESGLPAGILFIVFVFTVIATGMRTYYHSKSSEVKALSMAILMGLIAYYIHGMLNNYLDIDKTASLFWASTSMLVALDVLTKEAFMHDSEDQPE